MRIEVTALLIALAACAPADQREPAETTATTEATETPEQVDATEPTEGGPDSPPWLAARARGVDFRALGQEPGWSLDIDHDGMLVYAGDYGSDSISVATPTPTRDSDERVWTVSTQERTLVVRVTERGCQDTMSGERFTHTVTLDVDGRALSGCGRELVD